MTATRDTVDENVQQGYARTIEYLNHGYGRFQITELAETNEQSFSMMILNLINRRFNNDRNS